MGRVRDVKCPEGFEEKSPDDAWKEIADYDVPGFFGPGTGNSDGYVDEPCQRDWPSEAGGLFLDDLGHATPGFEASQAT